MATVDRLEHYVLPAMLVASLALNGMLASTIRVQRASIQLKDRMALLKAHEPKEGDRVPALSGVRLDGATVTYGFGDGDYSAGTIVYVLAADCHYCRANTDNMRALESQTRGRYRFVGVAAVEAGVDSYVQMNRLQFPILRSVPEAIVLAYGISSTPKTMLISSAGVVERIWDGAYSATIKADIEARLGVKLVGAFGEKSSHQ